MTHIRARLGVNEGGRRSYYEEVINMTAIGIINLSLVGWILERLSSQSTCSSYPKGLQFQLVESILSTRVTFLDSHGDKCVRKCDS